MAVFAIGRIVVRLRYGLLLIAACKTIQEMLRYISSVFDVLKYEAPLHSAKIVQCLFWKWWLTSQKERLFLPRAARKYLYDGTLPTSCSECDL